MNSIPTILIAGIGNTLRSDDGVAAVVCAEIEKKKLQNVTVITSQQLQTEFIDQFLQYDYVLVIDASIVTKGILFEKVPDTTEAVLHSSHHISLATLNSLTKQLHGRAINLYSCGIETENFETGEQLSAKGRANAEKAVLFITDWISSLTAKP
jgi:hydrogenase maturation protease